MMKKVLIVGDMHAPFHCSKTLKHIYEAIEREQPTDVVQIGDIFDFYSASKFPKNLDVITPEKEILKAREVAEEFWEKIRQAVPKASLYQILGNHCTRIPKRALERCPELYPLIMKSWKDLFKFDGVHSLLDIRDELILYNVVYEHGFFTQPGKHVKHNLKSTVIGHSHRPWVHYEKIRDEMFFEMNVGYCANPEHPALSYGRKKWNSWVKGYGIIIEGIPFFYPLE